MSLDINWDELLADCVDFARRLIQTPSLSHQEAALAELVAAEMRGLAFDEVWLDGTGNVCGRLHGSDRSLPALVLNTHTDHVDPGDPRLWPSPPYAGVVTDGFLVGRGAADIKGPLATQIYAMAALMRAGVRPRRDVVFTGVVQEELGGAGAAYWVEHLDYPVALVVLGEPSSNELALGHRGIRQYWVTFKGRSVHASVPHKGVNPNYALADFLARLRALKGELSAHPLLGATTAAPTIVQVDTTSQNVTPAWTRVLLDFRTASESPASLIAFIDRVADGLSYDLSDALAEEADMAPAASADIIFGFDTDPDSDIVKRAQAAIGTGMGRLPRLTSYQFATDGRHFVPYGIPIVGYSPADEDQAHVAGERISIEMMAESLRGHVGLMLGF